MMKTREIFATVFMTVWAIAAQEPSDSAPSRHKESETHLETDRIFVEILRNLPRESRIEVETASREKTAGHVPPSEQLSTTEKPDGTQTSAGSSPYKDHLGDLPQEVRNQIEKAIQDIEQRSEQRKLEFREHQKNKQ